MRTHHPIEGVDASWFRDLVLLSEQLRRRLEELDEHIRQALNDAYMQGIRDTVEHRTGVDPVHGPHEGR
jgi:hypothetical protein